jgi:hypothetical protein
MSEQARLGAALRSLRKLGFRAVHRGRDGLRIFEGVLGCAKGPVSVQLLLSDLEFVGYPTLILRELPEWLPPVNPHISADRVFCVLREGSVVLDRYHPGDTLEQYLDHARRVLDRIANDPKYCEAEFRGEFVANWSIAQNPRAQPLLVGEIGLATTHAATYLIGEKSDAPTHLFLADDLSEVERFCAAKHWSAPVRSNMLCWLFRTNLEPTAPRSGLPGTVKQAFDWMKSWDPNLFKEFMSVLKTPEYLHQQQMMVAIKTPVGSLAFSFELDTFFAAAYQKKPQLYRHYLHGARGGPTPIKRHILIDVGVTHVLQRNLTFGTLVGRRVVLIGCGAIGGFIAPALVRLGAGVGHDGKLELYDSDNLQADNVGRHRLGYESLFENKAVALRRMLLTEFPHTRIEATDTTFQNVRLAEGDLIINATGEEALSESLNASHVLLAKQPPLLHVWVKGNGECVQALWCDDQRGACFRCLRLNDEHRYREERFPVLKQHPERKFVGCRAFTPFAIGASMNAAALCMDMVADWLQGNVSPRFRSRATERADVRKVKNADISRLANCPACGST